MAVAVGDIIQLTDVQTLLGQQVLNVYFYRVVEWGASAEYSAVADAFQTLVTTYMDVVQSSDLVHTTTKVQNLTNGIDIYEEPISIAGAGPTPSEPSLVAWGFRLIRTNATTRHGSKRIAGVPGNSLAGNDPGASYLTPLADLANAMEAGLIVDSGGAFDFELEPVIVGRTLNVGTGKYELDLSVINPVQAVQFIRVTSQTTRRAGRGS